MARWKEARYWAGDGVASFVSLLPCFVEEGEGVLTGEKSFLRNESCPTAFIARRHDQVPLQKQAFVDLLEHAAVPCNFVDALVNNNGAFTSFTTSPGMSQPDSFLTVAMYAHDLNLELSDSEQTSSSNSPTSHPYGPPSTTAMTFAPAFPPVWSLARIPTGLKRACSRSSLPMVHHCVGTPSLSSPPRLLNGPPFWKRSDITETARPRPRKEKQV